MGKVPQGTAERPYRPLRDFARLWARFPVLKNWAIFTAFPVRKTRRQATGYAGRNAASIRRNVAKRDRNAVSVYRNVAKRYRNAVSVYRNAAKRYRNAVSVRRNAAKRYRNVYPLQ